ncbi:MAG: hydrogenase assembly protein HupF [Acidimicrobiales bacterium]|jgi:hypothetical protein
MGLNTDRLMDLARARGLESGPAPTDLVAASVTIARRIAAGGTLWCTSPSWPRQADLAAAKLAQLGSAFEDTCRVAAVSDEDLCSAMRALAHSGDAILLVASADEGSAARLAQRAKAWGLATIWIGNGPRPAAGAADYVLWTGGDETMPGDGGDLTLACALLVDLTSRCLADRSALEPEAVVCTEEVCITCSDEGRLGEVVALRPGGCAEVRTPSGIEEVDTTLVDSAQPGDLVLIHAGAIVTLVEDSAP